MSRSKRPARPQTPTRRTLHAAGTGHPTVTTPQRPTPSDPRQRRAQAVKISTVLAGILQLVLATLLVGIPGSSITLDPLPTPESDTTPRHAVALSIRPSTSPLSAAPYRRPATTGPSHRQRPRRTTSAPRPQRHGTPITTRAISPRPVPVATSGPSHHLQPPTSAAKPTKSVIDPPTGASQEPPPSQSAPPGQTKEPPGQGNNPHGPKNEDKHGEQRPGPPANLPPGLAEKPEK